MSDPPVRNIHHVLDELSEHWSPRTVAVVNDYDVRVVKSRESSPATATPRPTSSSWCCQASSRSGWTNRTSSSRPATPTSYLGDDSTSPPPHQRRHFCSSSPATPSTPATPRATSPNDVRWSDRPHRPVRVDADRWTGVVGAAPCRSRRSDCLRDRRARRNRDSQGRGPSRTSRAECDETTKTEHAFHPADRSRSPSKAMTCPAATPARQPRTRRHGSEQRVGTP